jgi:rhodanese-related sulfurtransferase
LMRIQKPLLLLFFCLPVIALVGGCTGMDTTPTPPLTPTPKPRTNLDMKPFVRELLANMPADWDLIAGRDVAQAKPFIVDVRQPEEYSQGFIQGAVNIPLGELAHSLQALPAMDKDIVLVCNSGHRSTIGMAVLQLLGYKKAKSLIGGMLAWQAAKLPIVTAPVAKRLEGPTPKVNADMAATLDYYLWGLQQYDWWRISPADLTEDRKLKSSAEMDVQPETFDQGPSLLVDVDGPEEYFKLNQTKALNLPLRKLIDSLDSLPIDQLVLWA